MSPLTDEELRQVFEIVAAGKGAEHARQLLSPRNRTTVLKVYNVVSEFERLRLLTCTNQGATEIAGRAKYGATLHYVQALFLRWKAWKDSGSTRSNETQEARRDPELGPHGRELFYFGQRLRDLAGVPSADKLVKAPWEEHAGQMWGPWSSGELAALPQDREEKAVARNWGFRGYDARKHPLFPAFRQHLHGHQCSESLDCMAEAVRVYGEACWGTYQAILEKLKNQVLGIPGGSLEVMAMSLLEDLLYRKQTGATSLSYGPRKGGQPDRPGYEVNYGARFLIVDDEALARRVVAVLQEMIAQLPFEAEVDALAKAETTAHDAKAKFRAALSPDALLRKLVLTGRCTCCP